jgi:hypothetical protein
MLASVDSYVNTKRLAGAMLTYEGTRGNIYTIDTGNHTPYILC